MGPVSYPGLQFIDTRSFAAGSIRSFAAETTDPGNPILRKQLALARAALCKAQELLRIKDLDLQRSWYRPPTSIRRPFGADWRSRFIAGKRFLG